MRNRQREKKTKKNILALKIVIFQCAKKLQCGCCQGQYTTVYISFSLNTSLSLLVPSQNTIYSFYSVCVHRNLMTRYNHTRYEVRQHPGVNLILLYLVVRAFYDDGVTAVIFNRVMNVRKWKVSIFTWTLEDFTDWNSFIAFVLWNHCLIFTFTSITQIKPLCKSSYYQ